MTITLHKVGKRYNLHWIFRSLSATLYSGNSYAITGPNGSGKSTLLLLLAGQLEAKEGFFEFQLVPGKEPTKPAENWHQYYSLAAPYLELIEELTLSEMLDFHFHLKPTINGISSAAIIERIGLQTAANKQIRNFSSGMKQKTKLALAIFADTPVLLLDEPGANLDTDAFALYQQLLVEYGKNRLVVIASNNEAEISQCKQRIHLPDYKN